MENIKSSFAFDKGDIINYNLANGDPGALALMHKVKAIFRPTIEQNKLSGKVELTFLSDRVHIGYENIEPFEFTGTLMELISSGNWSNIM
jgi:hypothetical protein